jgi:glycosyltransferase involved in cell wall biosynthesis
VISVIIATHNRRQLLAETLEAIAAQDWPRHDFEVVVVDNASSDGTGEMVASFLLRERSLSVRSLHEERPGKSFAVNRAVGAARGHILLCTDDDVLPDPGWARAMVEAMEETGADFGVGRIRPRWEAPPPSWLTPALHGVLAIPDNGPERFEIAVGLNEHVMPIGANMAVRAEVVRRIGGWREDLGKLGRTLRSGEDHEFYLRMLRAGMRGVYEPMASVAHFVPASRLRRAYFSRWLYDNGRTSCCIEREHPSTPRYLASVPRYLWRQAALDCGRLLRSLRPRHQGQRFAALTRLLWFAGYLREAWFEPPRTRPFPVTTDARPAEVAGSGRGH